jgi:hypothetical protein
MKKKKNLLIPTLAGLLLVGQPLTAETIQNNGTENAFFWESKDMVTIPYLFSTDSTGFAGGVGVIKTGLFQPQTTALATLFYGAEQDITTNGQPDTANFSGGMIALFDYRLPGTDRLFFSFFGLTSYFPKARHYFIGGNDSKENDAFETSGDSDMLYTTFRYVLPIGEGMDNPERLYALKHGFAQGREEYGGGTPFLTGFTSIGIETFYEYDAFENYQAANDIGHLKEWHTNGLRFFLEHENTDFDLNPSRGYQFRLRYSKD